MDTMQAKRLEWLEVWAGDRTRRKIPVLGTDVLTIITRQFPRLTPAENQELFTLLCNKLYGDNRGKR